MHSNALPHTHERVQQMHLLRADTHVIHHLQPSLSPSFPRPYVLLIVVGCCLFRTLVQYGPLLRVNTQGILARGCLRAVQDVW